MKVNLAKFRSQALLWCTLAIGIFAPRLDAAERLPRDLEGVGVQEQLGKPIDLDLTFIDEHGETVALRQYFDGERPVLFTLNYFGCPMLCGMQLNALTDGLRKLEWAPGENFRVVTLSFDSREDHNLAAAKKASHLESLGKGDVEWTFLTGTQENIRKVTDSFGYTFRYLEDRGEFAHPAAVMFLSPQGNIMRYLYGMYYEPRDLKLALLEAGEGKIGTPIEHFVLSCYMYDAEAGSYVKDAMYVMRLGGTLTLTALVTLLVVLWRRERLHAPAQPPLQTAETT